MACSERSARIRLAVADDCDASQRRIALGYSRKSIRLLTFKSSTRRWAELHEEAFRRLGAAPAVVVLDTSRKAC